MIRQRARGRYTSEQRQEDRSVNQFRDRMVDFGWLAERTERDVGEDVIVRIITNNQQVGIPVYVQLKSVTDLDQRKRGDFLPYRLEVDDLLRWETSPIPVVLCVWDVLIVEGRWQIVGTLLRHLNGTSPNWRTQKTVTVRIPWSNDTSDIGLRSIRSEIGYLLYPLIANDRPVEINVKVAFPNTNEAMGDRLQFEKFFHEGTPVSIDEKYIKDIAFSEWWAEWFAPPESKITMLAMGPSASTETMSATVTLLGTKRESVHYPNLEFRVVQGGTDVVVLSNEHQKGPLSLAFSVPIGPRKDKIGRFTFSVSPSGRNVLEIREMIRFLRIIETGGTISVRFEQPDIEALSMSFEPPAKDNAASELFDSEYAEWIDNLCYIQEQFGRSIRHPHNDIDIRDVFAADELKEILMDGKTVRHTDRLSFPVNGIELLTNLLERHRTAHSGSKLMIQQNTEEAHVELFGEEFHVGPMIRTVVGKLDVGVDELDTFLQQGNDADQFTIRLTDVEIIEEFSQWQN